MQAELVLLAQRATNSFKMKYITICILSLSTNYFSFTHGHTFSRKQGISVPLNYATDTSLRHTYSAILANSWKPKVDTPARKWDITGWIHDKQRSSVLNTDVPKSLEQLAKWLTDDESGENLKKCVKAFHDNVRRLSSSMISHMITTVQLHLCAIVCILFNFHL